MAKVGPVTGLTYGCNNAALVGEAKYVGLGIVHAEHGRGDKHAVILELNAGLGVKLHVGGGAIGMMEYQRLCRYSLTET